RLGGVRELELHAPVDRVAGLVAVAHQQEVHRSDADADHGPEVGKPVLCHRHEHTAARAAASSVAEPVEAIACELAGVPAAAAISPVVARVDALVVAED